MEYSKIKDQALAFLTRGSDTDGNDWSDKFDFILPEVVSKADQLAAQQELTFKEVREWVDGYGKAESRLTWWEAHARGSFLYQKIVKPLLSGRTEGSIHVERAAKPLKNKLWNKERNRLTDGATDILLRVGFALNTIFVWKQGYREARERARESERELEAETVEEEED